MKIDILSLNKKNKNDVSKALAFFTKGIFDCISDTKNNIEQMLIFDYMPIKFCENIPKINHDIKFTISYNKAISNENLVCSICHKEMNKNKNIYGDNLDDLKEHKKENNKCYYVEKEKNIICVDCYSKKNNPQ